MIHAGAMLLLAVRGEHARNFHRRNGFVGIQSHRCIVLIRSTGVYYVVTLILAENSDRFGRFGRRTHPLKGRVRGHTGPNDTSVQILLRNSAPLGHSNGGVPFRRIVFSGILIAGVVTFGSRAGFHGKTKFFDIRRSKGSASEGQEHDRHQGDSCKTLHHYTDLPLKYCLSMRTVLYCTRPCYIYLDRIAATAWLSL